MASLARLVLDKAALSGLKVAVWDAAAACYQDGVIEAYHAPAACYIVLGAAARYAVQFHHFTIEEEGEDLVLKVTDCTHMQLPAGFAADPDEDGGDAAGAPPQQQQGAPAGGGGRADRRGSLSPEEAAPGAAAAPGAGGWLSGAAASATEQLADLVGAQFSDSDGGFEAVVPSASLSASRRESAAGAGAAGAAGVAGGGGGSAPPSRLGSLRVGSAGSGCGIRISSGGMAEVRRLSSSAGSQAFAQAAAALDAVVTPADGAEPEALGAVAEAAQNAAAPVEPLFAEPHWEPPPPLLQQQHQQQQAAAEQQSWQEDSDDGGGDGGGGGFWGTPVKGGTPRAGAPGRQQGGGGGGAEGSLGSALMRRMANFEEISRMISGSGGGGQQQPPPQQAQQQQQAAAAEAAAGAPGPQGPPPTALEGAIELPIAAAVAEAEDASFVQYEAPADGPGPDFMIGTAAAAEQDEAFSDVGPRPLSGRASWRASRTTIDQELSAGSGMGTGDGIGVDVPQPLSSRRASRASARNLPQPLDDAGGGAAPAAGAGAAAAAAGAAAPRASSGGGGRRISRQASSRVSGGGFGDQGATAAALGAIGEAYVAGAPLHVPGPFSRRTSRTLSGRLPPDQEPATAMAALAEGDADVLPRPQAGPAPLSTIPSRRASATGAAAGGGAGAPGGARSGRGTPDSDGFGYSGFEENVPEPILPPQELRRRSSRLLGAVIEGGRGDAAGAPPAIGASTSVGGAFGAAQRLQLAAGGREAAPATLGGAEPPPNSGDGGAAGATRRASRTVSGLLQAAAAAAAAAEEFIGRHLSGGGQGSRRGTSSAGPGSARASRQGSGRLADGGGQEAPAAAAAPPEEGPPVFGGAGLGGGAVARKLADSFALPSVDSFSCPAAFPFGGGAGSAASASGGSLTFPAVNSGGASGGGSCSVLEKLPQLSPLGSALVAAAAAVVAAPPPRGVDGHGARLASGALMEQVLSEAKLAAGGSGAAGIKANPFAAGGALGFGGGAFGADGGGGGGGSGAETDEEAKSARIGTRVVADADAGAAGRSPFAEAPGGSGGGAGRRGVSIHEITPAPAEAGSAGAGAQQQQRGGSGGGGAHVRAPASMQQLSERERRTARRQWQEARAARGRGGDEPCSMDGTEKLPPPPSYAESVGGATAGSLDSAGSRTGSDADDERDASADGAAPREGGAPAVRAGAALDGGGGGGAAAAGAEPPGLVRRTASGRLPAAAGVPLPQQQLDQRQLEQQQQQQQQVAAAAARQQQVVALQQQLLAQNRQLSGGGEGVMLVGMPTYGYTDCDDAAAPLVAAHQIGNAYSPAQALALLEARAQTGRVVLHALLANSAQWYDCMVPALLGAQIGAALLPAGAPAAQRLQLAFVLFAAGHVLRPVGALVWPAVARRHGRAAVVGWTTALTAFPAALIGVLPNYQQAGYVGAAAALGLRLLQGAALGSEAASPAVFLAERAQHDPGASPCLLASLVPATAALGAALAAGACLAVAAPLDAEGLGLLVVHAASAALRLLVLRDPLAGMSAAEVEDRHAAALGRAIRTGWRRLLAVAAMGAFPAASFYLVGAMLPACLVELTSLAPHVALALHTANLVALVGIIVLGGWLADSVGRTSLLLGCAAASAALAYPVWMLIELGLPAAAWLGQLMLVAGFGLYQGAAAESCVMALPKGMRTTTYNLADTLATALGGGLAPLAGAALAAATGDAASPAYVMMAAAAVSAAACWAVRRTHLF
ncbi:MAG: hypothetical protein J3K34DRAFT_517732 [Monoraphidium minutum]|nr:MAG: hypothetical protein J3K34DRAFT_517732 [Monoraphidium minutum]